MVDTERPDLVDEATVGGADLGQSQTLFGLLSSGTGLDDQAIELREIVQRTGLVFGVTYNYSGYPMVREARALVRGGALGAVRLVQVEHASGWASTLLEADGHKQALWRLIDAKARSSMTPRVR